MQIIQFAIVAVVIIAGGGVGVAGIGKCANGQKIRVIQQVRRAGTEAVQHAVNVNDFLSGQLIAGDDDVMIISIVDGSGGIQRDILHVSTGVEADLAAGQGDGNHVIGQTAVVRRDNSRAIISRSAVPSAIILRCLDPAGN